MSVGTIMLYILAGVLAVAGVVVTIFSLPGVWLVYIATVIVGAIGGFQVITPLTLVILLIVSILSTFADELAAVLGTKKAGGSKYGTIGSVVGSIVGGIVGNILGVFIGAFLGAALFEYIFAKQDLKKSIKLGFASFLGFLIGTGLKIAVNIGIIVFVLVKLL